jgi:hypothetical protein
VPALAGCIALAVLFPNTIANQLRAEGDPTADEKKAEALAEAKPQPKNPTPFTRQNKPPELVNRPDKSKELKELEDELNAMMRKFDLDPNRETPEKLREKVAELTSMEERSRSSTRRSSSGSPAWRSSFSSSTGSARTRTSRRDRPRNSTTPWPRAT